LNSGDAILGGADESQNPTLGRAGAFAVIPKGIVFYLQTTGAFTGVENIFQNKQPLNSIRIYVCVWG